MLPFLVALTLRPPQEAPAVALQHVYAEYRNPDFSPLAHPERYFAPRLLRAILKDVRLAGPGYVGYLDRDPLCQCQDTAGLRAQVVNVTPISRYTAKARVRLAFGPSAKPSNFSLQLLLIETPMGWRIADVSSPDEPSLLRALEASNRRQHAKRR